MSALAHAAALDDAGRAIAGHDQPRGAAMLEAAMRSYDRAGATHDAARIRATLRDLGVHRRRPVRRRGAGSAGGHRTLITDSARGGMHHAVHGAETSIISVPRNAQAGTRNVGAPAQVRSGSAARSASMSRVTRPSAKKYPKSA